MLNKFTKLPNEFLIGHEMSDFTYSVVVTVLLSSFYSILSSCSWVRSGFTFCFSFCC